MATPPAPQQQLPATVTGPVDRVPCPHCGKSNNFRKVDEMLEIGNQFGCDHCKRVMQIAGVREVKMVAVRKAGAGGAVQRRR